MESGPVIIPTDRSRCHLAANKAEGCQDQHGVRYVAALYSLIRCLLPDVTCSGICSQQACCVRVRSVWQPAARTACVLQENTRAKYLQEI